MAAIVRLVDDLDAQPADRCEGPPPHAPWAYGALSAAVLTYVIGLILAAAPPSELTSDAYEVAYPVLELANLNNDWGFFSPDPGPGDLPRYEIVDEHGQTHHFVWMEALDRWDPAFFRYTTLFVNVADEGARYGDGAAAMLCRVHADLRPRKVVFTVAHQRDRSPASILAGQDILGDMAVEKLFFRPCPSEPL